MKMFVVDGEVARLEAEWPTLHGDARLAVTVELAWYLRQRDTLRALALADEAETALTKSRLGPRDRAIFAARLKLVRAESKWLAADLSAAKELAEQALREFTFHEALPGRADAHWMLGLIASDHGDVPGRAEQWNTGAALARQCGDTLRVDIIEGELARWEAFSDVHAAEIRWSRFQPDMPGLELAAEVRVYDYLGVVANLCSDFGQAATYRMRVYEAALATGQLRCAITASTNIGNAFKHLSYPHSALEWMQRSLELARPTGWPSAIGMCLTQTAETLRRIGQLDEAEIMLLDALAQLTPFVGSRSYALALEYLGDLMLDRGDYAAALEAFKKLQECADALKQTDFQSVVRRGQAHALSQLDRPDEALAAAAEALQIAQKRRDAKRQIEALKVLAAIHASHPLPAPPGISAASAPLHYLQMALEVATTIEGYTVPAALLDVLSHEYACVNDYAAAYRTLIQAAGTREKLHAAEAGNLAVAMRVQRETERLRADAEHQRRLAATKASRAAAEIQRLAFFDSLTGLANRTQLMDHLSRAISYTHRNGTRCAVLFLDLDRFKNVNDLHGHAAGDRLLRSVADRVTQAVRAESVWARLGGDEFALLLPHFQEEREATATAQRILETLAQPGAEGGDDPAVTASIGIAICPEDGEEPDVLLKNAETAMRSAKDAGRGTFRFFTPAMGEAVLAALRLERRLRLALDQDAFDLFYQPKVDTRTGVIVGMEALLRWREPESTFASPSEFIPVAERLGVIDAIGDWVLRTACAQNRRWQEEGLPALQVAVNVSALEFDDPGFPDRIMRALAASGLEPRYLEIELTEGALMKDPRGAADNLRKIKSLGVSIAIDDFGTGYSSLAYLGIFPIDRLKIDQSFIQALAPGHHATEITRTIIGIAKRLNMKVVAEGVETHAQSRFLKQEQCDELQGFLFGRPVPAEVFSRLLRQGVVVADET